MDLDKQKRANEGYLRDVSPLYFSREAAEWKGINPRVLNAQIRFSLRFSGEGGVKREENFIIMLPDTGLRIEEQWTVGSGSGRRQRRHGEERPTSREANGAGMATGPA